MTVYLDNAATTRVCEEAAQAAYEDLLTYAEEDEGCQQVLDCNHLICYNTSNVVLV